MLLHCWKCSARIDYPTGSRVGQRDSCPKCQADLHSCRNCQFYDPSKPRQCAEPRAALVRDKAAANLCKFYTPNPTLHA